MQQPVARIRRPPQSGDDAGMLLVDHLRARPRLAVALAVGIAAGAAAPGVSRVVTRGLVGWNAGVWLYLLLEALMMARADHADLRRFARVHAEGAATVLATVVSAALASLAAIVLELAAAKSPGGGHAVAQVLFTLVTVAGSWLLVAVLFTFSYASLYYRGAGPGDAGTGLLFPGHDAASAAAFRPGYADFLYFAFTIAVASQTADVAVSTRAMRKLVLLQSVLAFVFNTTLLALTINIAAGLF
jgi:uncharacterized membrane protein